MFTRQEAAQIRKEFWTTFGKYMQPVPFAGIENKNWINYKTSVKNIRFHLQAENMEASVAIELDHPDKGLRQGARKKFEILQQELDDFPGEWKWENSITDKEMLIYVSRLSGVNVLKKDDWHLIIPFFKNAMIALDEFWFSYKEIFDTNL